MHLASKRSITYTRIRPALVGEEKSPKEIGRRLKIKARDRNAGHGISTANDDWRLENGETLPVIKKVVSELMLPYP